MAVCKGAMQADSGDITRMIKAQRELLDFVRARAPSSVMDAGCLARRTPQEAAP